ncbi:hypothetical protein C8J57DRAFT_1283003 [Mycena rebaudengoi]|nr:hypothetical protein C8J57DRAFT_1283003 [Mycena rebaudengoi]
MPFFENATNFKITGGTFNSVSGDLNQYHTQYSQFTTDSYNDGGADGIHGHGHSYHPYEPRASRGRTSHPRPRAQQRGAPIRYPEDYDDYDDRGSATYGGYDEYEGRSTDDRRYGDAYGRGGREFTGGEHNEVGGNHNYRYAAHEINQTGPQGPHYFTRDVPSNPAFYEEPRYEDPGAEETSPNHDGRSDTPLSSDDVQFVDEDIAMVNATPDPTAAVAGQSLPTAAQSSLPAQSPPAVPAGQNSSPYERMRMKMGNMDINEGGQLPTGEIDGETPAPSTSETKKQKPGSFSKVFRLGTKRDL